MAGQRLRLLGLKHRSFVATGLATLLCVYLFASDGLSAFHTNLGSLAEMRAWLPAEDRPGDGAYQAQQDLMLNLAGRSFQTALRWDPDNSRAYHNLGLIYLAWGQRSAAREAFEQAVRLAPYSPFPNLRLGFLYDERGQREEALAAWRAARASPFLVEEGRRCQSNEDVLCAERYYALAIAVQPDYSYAYYRLGVLYADLGRPAEAIEAYNVALALGSKYDPRTQLIRARVLALEEHWEEAILAYRQAIEGNPYDPEPYEQIAAIMLREYQDVEGAIAWYRAAIGANEGRVPPYQKLAEIYSGRQDYAQCEFWYRRALTVGDSNAVTLAQLQAGLSRCALARGDLAAAVAAAEAAVAGQPREVAYHILLADIYVATKHYDLAIAGYQAALEIDPGNRYAHKQLEELGWRGP